MQNTLQNVLPEQIKFTYEISENTCIFLDLILFKNKQRNGKYKLATKLFQKKVNKYLVTPPFSNHAPHVHKRWITSCIKKIRLKCKKDIDFLLHKNTFFLRLLVRGYDSQFLIPIFTQKFKRKPLIKNLIQKQHCNKNLDNSKPIMIFKLPTCSRTCRLRTKLKKCLRFTEDIKHIRNKSEIIGNSHNSPILCYKGGKQIGMILVKATLPK